jgi:hypothetical protein
MIGFVGLMCPWKGASLYSFSAYDQAAIVELFNVENILLLLFWPPPNVANRLHH